MKSSLILFNTNLPYQPVITYDDAETDKLRILSDNKGLAGVYMWTHKESGRKYIGSAVDLSNRLESYYASSSLKRANTYISRAIISHGYSAFSLSILEYIDVSNLSKIETRLLILSREQLNLDRMFLEDKSDSYNILKIAGSPLGYKHTEEALEKFRGKNHPLYGKTRLPETKARISKAITGRTHSVETKVLIGKVHKGKCISAETKALMSLAKYKTIFAYISDTDSKGLILYKFFNSCTDAAKHFNCITRTLSRYLDKNKLYKDQYILSSSLIKNK